VGSHERFLAEVPEDAPDGVKKAASTILASFILAALDERGIVSG
jgi:hypothetical protein